MNDDDSHELVKRTFANPARAPGSALRCGPSHLSIKIGDTIGLRRTSYADSIDETEDKVDDFEWNDKLASVLRLLQRKVMNRTQGPLR